MIGIMKARIIIIASLILSAAVSCEILDNDPDRHVKHEEVYVSLNDVASMLADIPIGAGQLNEVHNAVSSSSDNGYDEEYTMKDLFTSPGSGVGDLQVKGGRAYEKPLRDLIEEYLRSAPQVKSGNAVDPDLFMNALTDSDIQIYWPYSENWDGEQMPVITFDPEDGADANIGYELTVGDDGFRRVEEIVVDEEMAVSRPVWVINRNSDAGYTTLEMLRREDPEWGEGGGNIVIRPKSSLPVKGGTSFRSLMLKEFTMKRNYDSWFTGASEFFVKTGAVEDFYASTEAEMRLYSPTVTDFLVVVRRDQINQPVPFNAILVSEWTDQVDQCAFMITEDDGGTITQWICSALVRVESKSYGIEISIPCHSRDDIVWRGQLSRKWLEANSNLQGHFGDVDLVFEVIEY